MGLVMGQIAESWDQLAMIQNFFLTPLSFLGGVFYSIKMLPDWAPKRVRITNKRETFFNGQYCAIANSGTGSIFRRIKKECETLGSLFLMETEILNLKT